MGVRLRLLIFIPKCIELNSETKPKLILISGLGLGVTKDPVIPKKPSCQQQYQEVFFTTL